MSASLAEPVIAAPLPAGPAKRGGVPITHAEPPALDPALGGDAALRRIGLAGLDHLSRNEAAALAGMPGETARSTLIVAQPAIAAQTMRTHTSLTIDLDQSAAADGVNASESRPRTRPDWPCCE